MDTIIPINFESLFHELENPYVYKRSHNDANINELDELIRSVSQFIEVTLFSKCGEFYYDRDFGFRFWEHIFNNISVVNFHLNMPFHIQAKEDIKSIFLKRKQKTELKRDDYIRYLKSIIEKYETRLSKVNIELKLVTENDSTLLFKFLIVTVSGDLLKNYKYRKEFCLKIGPIEKKFGYE